MYSNSCYSCSFELEIIKIYQSSHKMYSDKILNSQDSTTILNACTKRFGNLLKAPRIYTSIITVGILPLILYQEPETPFSLLQVKMFTLRWISFSLCFIARVLDPFPPPRIFVLLRDGFNRRSNVCDYLFIFFFLETYHFSSLCKFFMTIAFSTKAFKRHFSCRTITQKHSTIRVTRTHSMHRGSKKL